MRVPIAIFTDYNIRLKKRATRVDLSNPHVFNGRMKSLEKAFLSVGGQSKLAKSIGIAPQVVNNWVRRGNVPAEYCPAIERATNGLVCCEDLRPDVDWVVLRCRSDCKEAD
jgi:DNA-binding transcriptional regulator YdaS (Cro superfamily)